MSRGLKRIRTSRYVQAAAAQDSLPGIAERVKAMLWWGRRMTVARRYIDSGNMTMKTGQTLLKGGRRVSENYSPRQAHLGVSFEEFAQGFSISWISGWGDGTEEGEWKRWRAGDREQIEIVEFIGTGVNDGGPQGDEYLRLTTYNRNRHGEEILIGFDTAAYWSVAQERDEDGYKLAESDGLPQCREFAQQGPYRVPCRFPVGKDGLCVVAGDHVDPGAEV